MINTWSCTLYSEIRATRKEVNFSETLKLGSETLQGLPPSYTTGVAFSTEMVTTLLGLTCLDGTAIPIN